MYVRLVRFAFTPGKHPAAEALAHDLVPAIAARPGCKGVTCFGDAGSGEYGLYVLWDTMESAESAASVISPMLEQHLTGNVRAPADRRLFEVIAASS